MSRKNVFLRLELKEAIDFKGGNTSVNVLLRKQVLCGTGHSQTL